MSHAKSFEYVDAKESIPSVLKRITVTILKYTFLTALVGIIVFLSIGVVEIEKYNDELEKELATQKTKVEELDKKLKEAIIPEPTVSEFLENRINKVFTTENIVQNSLESSTIVESKQEIKVEENVVSNEITLEKVRKSFVDLWHMSVNR